MVNPLAFMRDHAIKNLIIRRTLWCCVQNFTLYRNDSNKRPGAYSKGALTGSITVHIISLSRFLSLGDINVGFFRSLHIATPFVRVKFGTYYISKV